MKLPRPETVTPTTPLRLDVAAQLGFPDGSMTANSLRRLAVAKKLAHEKIAGKYFVTLAAIEEMRAASRVPAKLPNPAPITMQSESEGPSVALAAMKARAAAALESLRPISKKGKSI